MAQVLLSFVNEQTLMSGIALLCRSVAVLSLILSNCALALQRLIIQAFYVDGRADRIECPHHPDRPDEDLQIDREFRRRQRPVRPTLNAQ
ncbi:hypothetical protein MPTK1_2g15130 [Marchantia polymorpha subsp. ruderalis]|nr:hypothetical protein Mp_2g15130 [Marchantia polymorpha subsp. ruderalis]